MWSATKANSLRSSSNSNGRKPLGLANALGGLINEDDLKIQRNGLRKAPSREALHANEPPRKKEAGLEATNGKENVAVRRLKERQALDEDEITERIDDTQLTQWMCRRNPSRHATT